MKNFNWTIFLLLIALLASGVFFIFSASSTKIGDSIQTESFYLKQIFWIIISIFVLFIIIKIPYPIIDFMVLPLYILTIILLVIVLFMPEINGSKRWIFLGIMNFQPSELGKISIILLIAKLISTPLISDWQIIKKSFLVLIVPTLLILREPDLGTTLTLLMSVFTILAVSDLPLFYLILLISPLFSIITSFSVVAFIIYIGTLIFVLFRANLSKVIIGFTVVINSFFFFITPVIWNNLKVYQQNRILSFLNPMRNPFGSGYQVIQSKIAIGSGGFAGKGFLLGTQKNLNFLPEHHTDFIFSVIGEEFGFLGCLFLLTLFFLFFKTMIKEISALKRKEWRYTSVGIFAYLTFQLFINIGMNIGVMPTTGIPLPFISYGGSSLLINVIGIGLILKFINEKSVFN
ncbi:MAG: rod shape-determining protein RodA [Candidatus Cloacimonetes bacterium]|jgi:rod shape determining protein RodA|nr:rod shape-determining protein RodA [Candidatus Cloacimonadota bacterium]MBT6994505.1 rod shape-determining protein RodA [Candidatus Cloacimonadota bacterium]MBT7468778.1 rod shape-determining protein RodA [Candidatus Cloacimonadota bacterium]